LEPGDTIKVEVEGRDLFRNSVVSISVTTEYARRIGIL
jgi:hypothetical protein